MFSNILRPSPSVSVCSRPFSTLLSHSFLLSYPSPSPFVPSVSVLCSVISVSSFSGISACRVIVVTKTNRVSSKEEQKPGLFILLRQYFTVPHIVRPDSGGLRRSPVTVRWSPLSPVESTQSGGVHSVRWSPLSPVESTQSGGVHSVR